MRIRLRKWGNSLALRIPKVFAVQLGLSTDDEVEMSLKKNSIVLSSSVTPPLRDLVKRITPENRHEETDWGDSVGQEVW